MELELPAEQPISEPEFQVNLSQKQLARFWSKIRMPDAAVDACWEWTRAKGPMGHGVVRLFGSNHFAHRVSYFLAFGRFPKRLSVCHHCDNPPCCNPKHLFLGTQADNMRDMFSKNRRPSAKGIRHASAKLNDEKVREIRLRYAAGGISTRALAAEYGMSYSVIFGIVSRKYWKHVA